MGVHDGHRERLRARFVKEGLHGMAEHNALELLLFYARPRCDTNELAHALLTRFGSIAAIMDAPLDELAKVKGVGESSAVLLKMIPELGALYLQSKTAPGDILDSTSKAGVYFVPKFIGKPSEEVYFVALDDKRKVLRCVRLADDGIVNAVRITVRRVVAEAVNSNATGVLLAHNHPGGIALPSAGDKRVTQQIFTALKMINVQLVDHIIVADDDYVSMADSGFMELYASAAED